MNGKKSLAENIFKGSLTVVIFTSITSPIGYLIKMMYSRSLSIEMFGLFYAMYTFYLLLSSFSDLGFGYSQIYLTPKYYKMKDYQTCWKLYKYNQIISVITSTIISITVIVFADWFSRFYFKIPEAKPLIYTFAVFLISSSLLTVIERLFMGLQQEKYYSTSQSVRMLFTLTISLFLWLIGNQYVVYYAVGWSIASILTVILYTVLLKNRNKELISNFSLDKKLLKVMYGYALPSFLTSSIYAIISSIDMTLLTILKGVSEVGVYAIVFPLATISLVILTPINTFVLPLISHLMAGEKDKVEKLLGLSIIIVPLIAIYFGLFIFLFPTQSVNILFGAKWVNITKLPLMVLSIGYVSAQLANILATFVYGLGYVNERFKASVFMIVINIFLSYILITRYSVLGITVSSTIMYIISIILNTIIIRKSIILKFPLLIYAKILTFSTFIYSIVIYFNLQPQGLLEFLLFGGVYSIVFGLFTYSLKLLNKNLLLSLLK